MAARRTGNKGPLMGWINETLGETWEDDEAEKLEAEAIQARAEGYVLRTVPMGGQVLVAGVDVQDDRFEVVVWAIGRGEEMWCIDYVVIPADPAQDEEWITKLLPYLQSTFSHESGQVLSISSTAIDMMGHFTHQGYNFVRVRERQKIFGVRGDGTPGLPISAGHKAQDVNYRGHLLKKGVKLWNVGIDTAKDLIFQRLKVPVEGPGYMHFSNGLPSAYYAQLTAEQRVLVSTARGLITRWVNVNRLRNEVLDCTVYALFAAHRLALHTKTDAAWRIIERKLGIEPNAKRSELPPQDSAPPAVPIVPALPPPPVPPPRPVRRTPERSPFASEEWSSNL